MNESFDSISGQVLVDPRDVMGYHAHIPKPKESSSGQGLVDAMDLVDQHDHT